MSLVAQVFLIDMARCTGCDACAIACRDRANLLDGPGLLRIERIDGGAYPHPTLSYRPSHCFHCAEPPCADVCPTDAIVRGDDGLVRLYEDACIGCGNCVDACPLGAIVSRADGTVTKCDACEDELARGWNPTCVRACPMRALSIVDANAPLPLRRMLDGAFDDKGIGPRVRYEVWADKNTAS